MGEKEISKAVIKRLPRYYRYLGELMDSGVDRISSGDLSERMHVTASQIRQDLNNFGGFGQQGYGYNVPYLYEEIGKILGLNKKAMFDQKPELTGTKVRGIEVHGMDELEDFLKENDIQIVALAIPKAGATLVAQRLVSCGVKAIWNFAHTDLNLPSDVMVENVHLSESLMRLSYNINRYEQEHGIK